MGVHGLTTFITKYHDKYKKKIYLHDCPIVIDGCNLMFFLYFEGRHALPAAATASRRSGGGSPLSKPSPLKAPHLFGGDYVTYAQNVREFCQHLKLCNISALVLFDGAYDALKIKTAFKRFAENLKENVRSGGGGGNSLKGVTPGTSYSPVFMKAVFVEILKEQKIPHYQTEQEADCTIAFIARKLGNCPILSSDSDFHMYVNAVTLPLPSLQFKKVAPKKGDPRSNKSLVDGESCPSPGTPSNGKMWVLHSQYVSLPNLCKEEFKLNDTRLLPLAAVILGNDWIQTGTFAHFHSTTGGGAKVRRIARIAFLLQWLGKQKSYTGVLRAMLATVNDARREKITKLVNEIVSIYEGLGGEDKVWAKILETGSITKFIQEDSSKDSEIIIGDLLDQLSLDESVEMPVTDMSLNLDEDSLLDIDEGEESPTEEDSEYSDADDLALKNWDQRSDLIQLPEWYLESHINCWFPTYLLKLVRNRMVFLSPQVEASCMPSSHIMSTPIIQVLGGLLLGDAKPLTLVSRRKSQITEVEVKTIGKLSQFGSFPIFNQDCPSFKKSLSVEERTQIVLETLGLFEPDFVDFINEWPMSLRFWIISLVFFLRSSTEESKEDLSRKTAIPVALAILMSVIRNAVLNSTGGTITQDSIQDSTNSSKSTISISSLLMQSNPVSLSNLRQFYAKYEIMTDVSSRRFLQSYDITRPYNLSQYTCILFHLSELNRILGDPFRAPRLSYNLNNWFVYSFSGKLTSDDGDFHGTESDYGRFLGETCRVEDMGTIADKILRFM